MARLAVLAIHGIGTTGRGYSKKLETHLRRAVGKKVSDEVCFVEIDYQEHLQGNQDRLWERVRRGLRWTLLRRFPALLLWRRGGGPLQQPRARQRLLTGPREHLRGGG